MQNLLPLILLLPLLGFLVTGLFGRRLPRAAVSTVACGVVLLAFFAAVVDFVSMLGAPVAARTSDVTLFTWLTSGTLSINLGLLSDPLSAVMLLVVTGVGFLIHAYSTGYMRGNSGSRPTAEDDIGDADVGASAAGPVREDPGYWRFFAYLNLFIFAMTLLVAADSFLFLLVGWALVGLASFLLIGFWYAHPPAVAAAKKAFVVNVIGDFGLMLAIFLLFNTFGTLAYRNILSSVVWAVNLCPPGAAACPRPLGSTLIAPGMATAIALLLFVAAAAKSAQLPLHVWLPDAMEGPTPVSALIHAATMVTAGAYLVARAAPIFASSGTALAVVGLVGGATALFAATIACVQTDIKRVLAYSTMSQLGYMFLGEAAGGFTAGIFHLTTHAYFKALLFLSAGAVIHALGGEQDMRKMGGLRRTLPMLFWSFVVGGLALAAVFPLSGFWSKDGILGVVLQRGLTGGGPGWLLLYVLGLLTAVLTGLYIFRLIFVVFLGSYRGGTGTASEDGGPVHLHAPGAAMVAPIGLLVLLSVVGGFIGTPFGDAFGDFLAPVVRNSAALPVGGGAFWVALLLGAACGPLGILIAWARYGRGQVALAPSRNPLVHLLEHRYYLDDLYDRALVRPLVALGGWLRRGVEGVALDGGTRGLGRVVGRTSAGLRALQTGYARNYALAIFVGAALMLLYYVTRR